MAIQSYFGIVANVQIHEETVEKHFVDVTRRSMYKAEEEGLRFCATFGFTPLLLALDTKKYILTMQRVGKCDALDWWIQYGEDPSAKGAMKEAAKLLRRQLLFLHDHAVYHGDVKPENFTFQFDDADPYTISRLYLIDFATSSFLNTNDPTHRTVHVYSDFYSSPESTFEMYRDSKRDDVWGFIACLFVWISDGTPMFGQNDFWHSSFKDWYYHGHFWYWEDLVAHETMSPRKVETFKSWFTALKFNKDGFEYPSEEEIDELFEP